MESLVKSTFWRDRPTFVTGATGLVGAWLVQRLVDAEADVVVLVRDWVPQSEFVRSGPLESVRVVRGDVRDQPLLERVLAEYEVDTVFHLAAQTIVTDREPQPDLDLRDKHRGNLGAARGLPAQPEGASQVVLASSDKAYGDHEQLPYDEDAPLQGRHPYDVSKSCADLIAKTYATSYDLPVVITRCGNFYGGGDLNWNRIVPGTIRSVIRGDRPVIRSDGTFVRDYFYVEDGAAAYMTLAEWLAEHPEGRGEAFNFSNEEQVTVIELVDRILELMESSAEPEIRNETSNEIRAQFLSAAKARTVLGWKPLFSLDEGLRRSIAWYSQLLGAA